MPVGSQAKMKACGSGASVRWWPLSTEGRVDCIPYGMLVWVNDSPPTLTRQKLPFALLSIGACSEVK